jgi:hypothetical protein
VVGCCVVIVVVVSCVAAAAALLLPLSSYEQGDAPSKTCDNNKEQVKKDERWK